MFKNNLPLFFLALLLLSYAAAGQDSSFDVKKLVEKASDQSKQYTNTFKNLITEETKTIETYDEKGDLEKTRKIVSTFIIYELSKKTDQSAEFRNVLSVDGKPVKNSEKRTQKFFERIVRAESSEKELEKLNGESLRYDGYLKFSGFTLSQAIALSENLIPFFDFKILSREDFNERDVFILSYNQQRESPDIKFTTSKDMKLNARLSGLLWIDAETFQVWREERNVTIQPEMFDKPVTTSIATFEYRKSDFEIFTPKKITHTNYAVKALQKTSVKDARLTLEYGRFSKPDTKVESADVK